MLTITTHAKISKQSPYIVVEGVPDGDYEVVIVLNPAQEGKRDPITFGNFNITFGSDETLSRSEIYGEDGR